MRRRRPPARRWRGLAPIAGAIALALAFAGSPQITPARADGDPASDVLVAAPPVFLAADSGAGYAAKAQLAAQLARAARRGHPLRVAVIATRADLGSVTALWGHPTTYAQFLGRELSLNDHGELLVVMPSGFGVSRDGAVRRTALSGLAPRSGHLIQATEQAVERLTGAAPGGAVAVAGAGAASPASGLGWWLASALAVAMIAAAWTASLRARPLRAPASGR